MKRIKAITGILVLALLLFCGCGNQPEDTTTSTSIETTTSTQETTTSTQETTTSTQETTTTTQGSGVGPSAYDGFMTPEAGNWVKYVNEGNTDWVKQRMEVVREENYEGTECLVLEIEFQNSTMIVQAWASKDTREIKRYVMKKDDKVHCLETGFSENMPEGINEKGTPEEFSPDLHDIYYGTYTTDAGTTVDVAKFRTEEGEAWVSSEVPFGIVKIMGSDDAVTRVSEFGLTGASGNISQSEIENCQDM